MGMPRWDSLWYYHEGQELLRAYEAIHGSTQGRIVPHNLPLPKLSDVLSCAQLAKAESVIWAAAQKEADMTERDKEEAYKNDDPSLLLHLMSPFIDWFRLKNCLFDIDDRAFTATVNTLRDWARPDFSGDEVAVLRLNQMPYPGAPQRYVDDITEQGITAGITVTGALSPLLTRASATDSHVVMARHITGITHPSP